jgi:glycosyltransferase involved in cell wall biosynthesis
MRVVFFHRHLAFGFSIQHVFNTVEREIRESEENVEITDVYMPSQRSLPWDLIKNGFYTFRHRNRTGVNHISGQIHDVILGLIGCKTVLTVHDLVFIDNVKNPIKRFYKWLFWLYFPVKLADKITCISNKTKQNILMNIQTDKLVVIHNPIDPLFKYVPKTFNAEKPVILHIGTGWNKNLKRTIQALNGLSCHLRIIGKLSDEVIDLLQKHQINYSNGYQLTDEEIRKEYINCDIVNFPSEYEGFGMPIIEGQKTGRVVITSQIEPLIEVSGNAVQYVNPYSITSIREGYTKLIKDADYRKELIERGLKNTDRFDITNIAKQYLSVYKEVMRGDF